MGSRNRVGSFCGRISFKWRNSIQIVTGVARNEVLLQLLPVLALLLARLIHRWFLFEHIRSASPGWSMRPQWFFRRFRCRYSRQLRCRLNRVRFGLPGCHLPAGLAGGSSSYPNPWIFAPSSSPSPFPPDAATSFTVAGTEDPQVNVKRNDSNAEPSGVHTISDHAEHRHRCRGAARRSKTPLGASSSSPVAGGTWSVGGGPAPSA